MRERVLRRRSRWYGGVRTFFFLSSSMDLKTPSRSSSSALYSLFTSFFTLLPISFTSLRSRLFVLIITESVSP